MTYFDYLDGDLTRAKVALLRLAVLDLNKASDDDCEHVVSTVNSFFDALQAARTRLRNAEAAS